MMDEKLVISLGAIYVFIYYFLGKYLVRKVLLIQKMGSAEGLGERGVERASILSVIFNDDTVDQLDSTSLRIIFYIVKFMLMASPLMFILVFFLL